MSFINSLRRAFGIGDEYAEDDYQENDSFDNDETPAETNGTGAAVISDTDPSDETLTADILKAVVELFNSTQPEFVKNHLNTKEQCQEIYASIDDALKNRISEAIERGRLTGRRIWDEEQRKLSEEVEKLKLEKNEFQQKRDESKSALLSAERQKRAMTERIRDLENQNAKNEAEIEQLTLENRSLLNKIRVAGVIGHNADAAEITAKLNDELQKANDELQELKNTAEEEKQKLEQQIAKLNDDYRIQGEFLEKAKSFSTDTASKDRKIQTLEQSIQNLNAEIEGLKTEIDKKNSEIKNSRQHIETMEKDLETAAYIKEQVDKIEISLSKKESQIDSARKENKRLAERISQLETTLADKVDENTRLHDEIDRLKLVNLKNIESIKQLESTRKQDDTTQTVENNKNDVVLIAKPEVTETTQSKRHKKRGRKPKNNPETTSQSQPKTAPVISAIDELLDSNDWFVAPDLSDLVKEPTEPEDFGYKPPQKKSTDNFDDKQLSLW